MCIGFNVRPSIRLVAGIRDNPCSLVKRDRKDHRHRPEHDGREQTDGRPFTPRRFRAGVAKI